MVLAQKEIIVIELDGIRAEVSRQMAQDAFGPGGRLHFLLRSICRNNAAETALIWTSYTGLVHGSASAEKRRSEVVLDGKPMIGIPGKRIGAFHRPFGIVIMPA